VNVQCVAVNCRVLQCGLGRQRQSTKERSHVTNVISNDIRECAARVEVCCKVLRCVAACCSVLQRVAV